MKIIRNTHVALAKGAAISAYGSSEKGLDAAVRNLCRELRGWGPLIRKDAVIDFCVYSHGPDERLFWDDRGVFVIDAETETIKRWAMADHYITDCRIDRPLSTMRLHRGEAAYRDGGEAVARLNAEGAAPIGEAA